MTVRQLRFIDYYLEEPNASKAALRAGYSAGRADVTGAEMLAHPLVAAEIARRQAALNKKFEIKQERVIEEVAALAFSDISELLEDSADGVPRLVPVAKWSPRMRKAISAVKIRRVVPSEKSAEEPYDIIEFKLWDKPGALDKLMKRLEMEGKSGEGEFEKLSDEERRLRIAEILSRGVRRRAEKKKAKVA